MSYKILLVDDHTIFRQGLEALLAKETDLNIVGQADNGLEAIDSVEILNPDLVIMDITMPKLNGIDATREITSKFPNVKILILSRHTLKKYIVESIKAGAAAYLCKNCNYAELITAIKALQSGQYYISPLVTSELIDDYINLYPPQEHEKEFALDNRDREIIQMLAEGKSTKEIALLLDMSQKTIDALRRKIMDKIGIHSVAELTKYAIAEGITSIEFPTEPHEI